MFRDAWGGERFDTATGVFTNPALVDGVLARLADVRPPEPDAPQLARTVSTADRHTRGAGRRRVARVRHPAPALDVGARPRRQRAAADPQHRRRARRPARAAARSASRPTATCAPGCARSTVARSTRTRSPTPRRVPAGAHARTARTGHVPDRRHGVADVDQRPHEPLPPRRDARGSRPSRCATSRSASSAPRCRRAGSTRPARSCASTSCSPSCRATTRRSASGPTSCRSSGARSRGEPWGWQFDGHHLCINTVVFDGRDRDDADVHGRRAAPHPPRPARRHLAVRPGGSDSGST